MGGGGGDEKGTKKLQVKVFNHVTSWMEKIKIRQNRNRNRSYKQRIGTGIGVTRKE